MTARIGVCSWSLQPDSPTDLCEKLRACEARHVQLALDPVRTGAWSEDELLDGLRLAEIGIVSGMMGTVGEDYSTLESIKRSGSLPLARKLRLALLVEGVDISGKPGGIVSCTHGDSEADATVAAFQRALERLRAEGEIRS